MAEKQVLSCPLCGISGSFSRFGIDEQGGSSAERPEHIVQVSLRHRNPKTGQVFWTRHTMPLPLLLTLRQRMAEELGRVDLMISEAMRDE